MEFAEHEFRLSQPQADKRTLREHLEAVAKQTGDRPEELEGPELPIEVAYLWDWYLWMSDGRPRGVGPAPIPPSEIKAWTELTGVRLQNWELEALRKLDAAFLTVANSNG